MSPIESIPAVPLRTTAQSAVVWLTIAVLTLSFFLIEHFNSQVSSLQAFTATGDEMAERAAEGDLGRRVAIPIIGLYGLLLLMWRRGERLRIQNLTGWFLLAYGTWCGLSFFWSEDPSMTFRHLSVLLFCSLGALGIARQVTMRDLCWITLAVATLLILNGVRTEIALGTFQPSSSEYRFAGTLHPNVQAPYCAMLALAAGFLASEAKRGRLLLWGLCLMAVLLLVLTKSRTVCGALAISVAAYAACRVSWQKLAFAAIGMIWLSSSVALVTLLFDSDVGDHAARLLLIGRQEEADSLSGRVPLWAELLPHGSDNLTLGHGYLTFWSPKRIDSFSRAFQFTVPDGHCAYLDTFLDLGLIGLALFLGVLIAGIVTAARRFRSSGDIGYGFLLTLLICRALNGLLESAFASPTNFCAFVMVCGLMHLGFCQSTERSVTLNHNSPELAL